MNDESSVSEWREDGLLVTIVLKASDQATGDVDTSFVPAVTDTIVSGMFGRLHIYGEPGAPPFVHLGQTVEAGQRVALLEAMKTFCPVVSIRAGRIVEILVEHGAEVASGQPLFRVA